MRTDEDEPTRLNSSSQVEPNSIAKVFPLRKIGKLTLSIVAGLKFVELSDHSPKGCQA